MIKIIVLQYANLFDCRFISQTEDICLCGLLHTCHDIASSDGRFPNIWNYIKHYEDKNMQRL